MKQTVLIFFCFCFYFKTEKLCSAEYTIAHDTSAIVWINSLGHKGSNNYTLTNIVVYERAFSHFVVTTNGDPLFSKRDFPISLHPVDVFGYHSSVVTNHTVTFTALTINGTVAPGKLSLTNAVYLSPNVPDLLGQTLMQSYSGNGQVTLVTHSPNLFNLPNLFFNFNTDSVFIWDSVLMGYGDEITIALSNVEINQNSTRVEQVQITLTSPVDLQPLTLTLRESGADSPLFTNRLLLAPVGSSLGYHLQVADNIQIVANYLVNTDIRTFTEIKKAEVSNPLFVSVLKTFQPVIIGEDSLGRKKTVTSQFSFTSLTPIIFKVSDNNFITALSGGRGEAILSSSVNQFGGKKIIVLSAPAVSGGYYKTGNYRVLISPNSFSSPIFIEVRSSADWESPFVTENRTDYANQQMDKDYEIVEGSVIQVTFIKEGLQHDGEITDTHSLRAIKISLSESTLSENILYTKEALILFKMNQNGVTSVDNTSDPVMIGSKTLELSIKEPGVYCVAFKKPIVVDILGPIILRNVILRPNPINFDNGSLQVYGLNTKTRYVKIFDSTGTYINKFDPPLFTFPAGDNNGYLIWDGLDSSGKRVRSGIYFIEVRSDNNKVIYKLMVNK